MRIVRVRLHLAKRAAYPAGPNAIVDIALWSRAADVGQHAHPLCFAPQLDFEFVAPQEPRGVGFEAVFAAQPAREAVGGDVEVPL